MKFGLILFRIFRVSYQVVGEMGWRRIVGFLELYGLIRVFCGWFGMGLVWEEEK